MADGKWITGLSAGMPVADAARVVLATRFEVVRHYLPLAAERPYDDPEYVHQLRVGTRRAGAALKVFAAYLPKKHLRGAKDGLRAIRQAAGDARDWDVFLAKLADGQEHTTAARAKPAFDFLIGYTLGERSAAQARLADAAAEAGPRFVADTTTLPAHVRAPKGEDATPSFGDVATAHLGDLLSAFNAAVEANPDEPAALHQLRILGKRVRYAVELFAPCFAPPLRDSLYPAIESLQESLGELQDAAVGIERLEGLRDLVKKAIPAEWPRLEAGIEKLLAGMREKVPAGLAAFRSWREEWSRLTAANSLDSLRLTLPTADQPAV